MNKKIDNGWYSHPNIGLLKVFTKDGLQKLCPIRKESITGGKTRFVAMRSCILTPEIAARMKPIPIPPNFIEDRRHMPTELRVMYHQIVSPVQAYETDEEGNEYDETEESTSYEDYHRD